MRIKERPEDFVVTESYRFEKNPSGPWRVYLMDKQKLSTFAAVERICERFEVPPSAVSFCGLKDKQGRTTQLLAVRGVNVDMQDPDLRLKFLGRTTQALSSANTTSNRFSVTVRDLSEEDVASLPEAVAEVRRLGVVNYFDSQRFGSLKHGQGFIAKDLIRGEFEVALKNFMAKPSELDRTADAKVKAFFRDHWNEITKVRCPFPEAKRYRPILDHLRHHPHDFRGAFLRVEARYRALQLFTYQSFLWNESVRAFLLAVCAGQNFAILPYQVGTLLFPRSLPVPLIPRLRKMTFPLLAPDALIRDPAVKRAVDFVLAREKLTLSTLRVPGTEELFFKYEERPLFVFPEKLVIGKASPDNLHKGRLKVNVAFTLSPGAYATLVIRRLFHQVIASTRHPHGGAEDLPPAAPRLAEPAPRPPAPGFLERQRAKKIARAEARKAAAGRR
jgi:tRNA pseudouridine13 synthase